MHGLCHMEFLTGLSCRCLILVRLSIAMIKHHDQKCLGEERLFSSYCLQFIIQENQGRNLETGPEAESMEEHWLLTCSPRLLQPRTTCLCMAPPTVNTPHPCLQATLRKLLSEVRLSVSKRLRLVRNWHKTSQHISGCAFKSHCEELMDL